MTTERTDHKAMKRLYSLDSIPEKEILTTGIDLIGNIKDLFKLAAPMPGGLFLLCLRGQCTVRIHLNTFQMRKDSIAIVFPNQFFQIVESDRECRFVYVGFSPEVSKNPSIFTKAIQYAPTIFEQPVSELTPDVAGLFFSYFKLLMKARHMSVVMPEEQAHLICLQLIMGIGSITQKFTSAQHPKYNRNEEIVKDLIRIIVDNYKTNRNITFYAEKMHLSSQHLSTTIKKTTGKTLTDIISSFVIRDAQAKLRSTELTIQEIAYSLSFPDISFFGKYFKRYTGVSPKRYRNMQ